MNQGNQKNPRAFNFFLLVILVLTQAAYTGSNSTHVQRSLTGWLTVVWGDGGIENRESPELLFYLTTEDRQQLLIHPTQAALDQAGGIHVIDRQRVSVEGFSRAGATTEIEVSQIRLLNDRGNGTARASVSGSQKYVNILCRYKDSSMTPHHISWFNTLFGNAYPGLDHYWREASFNKINLIGTTTVGWFNLPKNQSDYMDSGGNLNLGQAAEDCTAVADASVFFPDFVGINLMFNETVGGFAFGGGWCLVRDGVDRCWSMTWLPPWGYENQSPLAHEMGHSFGLPHSSGPYGQTYDSSWDVMSNTWSCTTDDPNYHCLAQHTISYHKSLLGWIPAARRLIYTLGGATQTIHITNTANGSPATEDYLMGRVSLPGGQFYTVEARRFTGYDGVARIPGEAIVIHKVTPGQAIPANVVDASKNDDPNDAGAMWLPGESFIDQQNGLAITIGQKTSTGFYVTFGNPTTAQFSAPGQFDGTIIESAPNSGTGGTIDSQGAFLSVGDDAANRQVCSILLFTTGSLPDTAKVISARLTLQRAGVVGTPGGLGSIWVDVNKGSFSGSTALESSDFEAPASAENHRSLSASGTTYATNISPVYVAQKGATQFRLCYANDDGDSLNDMIKFYGGDADATVRPVLTIAYVP
jgi:hypothetical protein